MTPRTMPPPSPPAPTSLHAAWQTLADGLTIQRLHLHLDEWRSVLVAGGPLPDIDGVSAARLAGRPRCQSGAPITGLLDDSGLGYWYELPQSYGPECTGPGNPLALAAHQTAEGLVAEVTGQPWPSAVAAVCDAAAWWVGFFAVLRHRGVHHTTLEPHPGPLHVRALESAVRVVAVGMATRVLEAALDGDESEALRAAYCRALTGGIEAESELPALIDELGELRLVDLVSTSARWRGRFTKYAGGTGAGQVE